MTADPAHHAAWQRIERAAVIADRAAAHPAGRALVQQALAEASARSAERRAVRGRAGMMALAAGVVLTVGLGGLFAFYGGWWADSMASGRDERGFATGPTEARHIRLADGSGVALDGASVLQVEAGSGDRQVRLVRGKARFAVAPNSARPFTVAAGAFRVTALGTQFTVDVTDGLLVDLREGRARVERLSDRRRWLLEPGMVLVARGASAPVTRRRADANPAADPALLTFDDAPLTSVVGRMNPHLERPTGARPRSR